LRRLFYFVYHIYPVSELEIYIDLWTVCIS